MNQVSRYILGIYQVSLMVRDTLEYGMVKETYNKDVYLQRKAHINHGLEEGSPLSFFLKNNGEVGEKIRSQLQEFIDDVYGDESNIVKIEDDKVIVDRASIVRLYDYIVGIHETLKDILDGHYTNAEKEGNGEHEVKDLIDADDKFYRSLACLTITDEIHRSFVEFNKTMNEAKGQANPQSNFVLNEIKRYVGFYKFVVTHSKIEDPLFKKATDDTMEVLYYMEGSKKLESGQNLKSMIDALHKTWQDCCAAYEPAWRQLYIKEWQVLIDFEKQMFAKKDQENVNAQENSEDRKNIN